MSSAGDVLEVGVIGLGAMGWPMTQHLLRRPATRVAITGRGSDRYRELIDAGATWHDSARSLARTAQVLLLMLPDLPQVEEVLNGPDGILAAEPDDLLLVLSSTSSPTGVRVLAERLARQTSGGVRVVDAPVSGGVEGAAAATLSIMVGGDGADAALTMAVLEACGRPVHLGPLGAGQVAKACNQLLVASTVLAVGEAFVLADRSGLDLDKLMELLQGGYADSRVLRTHGSRMLEQDYRPRGPARYLLKDLGFGAEVAEQTHTDVALLPAVRAAYRELVGVGLGDLDMAVTRRFVEERTRTGEGREEVDTPT
jgi:3-hydroxyisobutyrate dehydrogenase-like beta-hydroxyacid dehydrogenase